MKHKSLKNLVYDWISEKIGNGTIKVNEKISEKIITEELNVSRTPVREALIQLSSEGYIENIPRKGFVVKALDKERVTELYSLLGVLDAYSSTLAIDKLDSDDYLKMEMYIFGMNKAIKTKAFRQYYDLQLKFHDVYINKSGNKELINTIKKLRRNFIKKQYTTEDEKFFTTILSEANKDHEYILKLLKEKKADVLEKHLKEFHWNPKFAFYET